MFTFRTLALLVAIAAMPVITSAQNNRPRPSPTPTPVPRVVTAQFNHCAAGDTICEGTNRVRQDVNRPFTNGSEGVNIANATASSGDIVIYLENSTRSVIYDLRDRVYTGNPQPTWTGTPQNFKVQFVLHDANLLKTRDQCATSTVCEANMTSAMNGGFYIGRVRYRFQWNPGSVLQYINWVQPTSPVNINYKRDATGETWTVTPAPNASFQNLAGMQVEDGRNISFGGQYNMPFTMVISSRNQ